MEQEVLRTRNAAFALIYFRSTTAYKHYIPRSIQWSLEVFLLVMASLLLFLWSYVHNTYIINPTDCFDEFIEKPFPSNTILQIEAYSNTSFLWRHRQIELDTLYRSYHIANNTEHERSLLKKYCNSLLPNVTRAHYLCEAALNNFPDLLSLENTSSNVSHGHYFKVNKIDINQNISSNKEKFIEEFIDIYSLYDLLGSHDPDKSTCFGGSFGRFLTRYFLGYDMMIISSFRHLLPVDQETGYVKNLLTGSLYYYKVQWMGKWRYFAGVLPALFFTLVASILSRQVHFNLFKFFNHIQLLLNQGIPMPVQIGAQVPFLIVTYAAIGLIIVMSEVLHDDSMFCLMMIGTVWEADQFYAVYCRQKISQLYFPWFFFLYHFLPYAYYIRFNGQFWFIPFLLHWIMLQHAMLFFIHHCEIPAPHHNQEIIFHLQPPVVQDDLGGPEQPQHQRQ